MTEIIVAEAIATIIATAITVMPGVMPPKP
jgi:hypothetical protein